MRKYLLAILLAGLVAAGSSAIAATDNSFTLQHNGWTYSEPNIAQQPINHRTTFNGGLANFYYEGGADNLQQNWWWYRTTGDTREYALSNQAQIVPANPADRNNVVELVYYESLANGTIPNALEMRLRYTLTGIDPTMAELEIKWEARNLVNVTTDFDFFAYIDPDWGANTLGTLEKFNPLEAIIKLEDQNQPRELIFTASPDHLVGWEIMPFSVTRDKLSNNNVNNLSNTVTPLLSDSTAALQWHFVLNQFDVARGTLTKKITIIPEWNSLILAIPGLASLAALRRRRSAS